MDDIARDSQGRPILDRFGRPVRRSRAAMPQQQPPSRHSAAFGPNQPLQQHRAPRPGNVGQVRTNTVRPQYSSNYAPPPQQPPVRQRPSKPRRRRRRGSLKGKVTLVLLSIVTLFVVAVLWVDASLQRVEAQPDVQVPNTGGTNWLLVGSDSRQGLDEAEVQRLATGGDIGVGRTDTIMLLHIPLTGEPTLVSIPRDSYVEIPGYGSDKINAAFSVGGPKLLTQTVEQATGLRINHYAEIGFGGFAGIVDALGGIEICVDQPIDDPLAGINLQPGCQIMDGPTALGFVRTRATPQGDLDRVARQRQFFSALVSESTKFKPFSTIPLINKVAGAFTVGESDHAWHLAWLGFRMRGGMKTETVPVGGFADYDVGNVVIWDEVAAEELFSQLR
ncbi:MAG: LCP family protein [Corynebacterium sp.]|nr:LCP family protein [Corynebacterium sp.]